MAITAAVGRIGTALLAMLQTRLELATVEVQEEWQRMLSYLAWTLLAVLLMAGAALLAAAFVILLFWDSYRLQAVAALALLFALAGGALLRRARARFAARPPLLAATLAELRSDIAFAAGAERAHES
jgi:uncharacterized membrane protein YqjE